MDSNATSRIWHVGNWCIHLGQTYVESPFKSEKKDVELLNDAQPFVERGAGGDPRSGDLASSSGLAVRLVGTGHLLDERCKPALGINFMKWKQYRQFWKQVFAG